MSKHGLQGVPLQGDPSGCSLGFVDIKTKDALLFMPLLLKATFVLKSTKPREHSDGSPATLSLTLYVPLSFVARFLFARRITAMK